MIKITKEGASGEGISSCSYTQTRGVIGKLILPVTRWFRTINVEKYMNPAQRHLDIACGDGYLLRRSRCEERFGLDKLLGDEVGDKLNFPDNYFDYVTILAALEHFSSPEALFKEIARVLKSGGHLIITTPKRIVYRVRNLYAVYDKAGADYDLAKIRKLSQEDYIIKAYRTFLFGLNQVFCLEKR